MPSVKFVIIVQFAAVTMVSLAMLSLVASVYHHKRQNQFHNQPEILVFLHLVVPIHSAVILVVHLHALVCQTFWEHHHRVDQNVLLIRNVVHNKPALIKNVAILAPDHVVLIHYVLLELIHLFALAKLVLPEIPSSFVIPYLLHRLKVRP